MTTIYLVSSQPMRRANGSSFAVTLTPPHSFRKMMFWSMLKKNEGVQSVRRD